MKEGAPGAASCESESEDVRAGSSGRAEGVCGAGELNVRVWLDIRDGPLVGLELPLLVLVPLDDGVLGVGVEVTCSGCLTDHLNTSNQHQKYP